jgi:hypothetical protein
VVPLKGLGDDLATSVQSIIIDLDHVSKVPVTQPAAPLSSPRSTSLRKHQSVEASYAGVSQTSR